MKKPNKKSGVTEVRMNGEELAETLTEMHSVACGYLDFSKNLMEKFELYSYLLEDGDVNGKMIDESEDITPEQVAIIGGYVIAKGIHDDMLQAVEDGHTHDEEEAPKKSKSIGAIGLAINSKTGRTEVINGDDMPQEIKDLINRLSGDN